ncbi:MAG: hypothetical protein ABH829_02960 [archaeon]
MRGYLAILLAVLVLGCVSDGAPSQPGTVNVKDTFNPQLPSPDGYYINTILYIETPSENLDKTTYKVEQGVYLGEELEPFIYTKQWLREGAKFDFAGLQTRDIAGITAYLDYRDVIPMVSAQPYNILWVSGNVVHAISGFNQSVSINSAEAVLGTTKLANAAELEFADIIRMLPDPAEGWNLYMVTPGMYLSSYTNTVGYYIREVTNETRETMEVLVVEGDGSVRYIEGKINSLENRKGATMNGKAVYEGSGMGIFGPDYKMVYFSESRNTGMVVSIPLENKDSPVLEETFIRGISQIESQ